MSKSKIKLKCIFIGNRSVGKTSIILRYTKNEFTSGYIPTIGADFTTIDLKFDKDEDEFIHDQTEILDGFGLDIAKYETLKIHYNNDDKIYVWDLAGQRLFQKIRRYYMSNAFISILIFDINDYETYDLENWINDLEEMSPDSELIIAANKTDLVETDNKKIVKRIKKLIKRYNHDVYLVSAKSGEGIKELFIRLKLLVMQKLEDA
ncbi:MAG: GTP-binding protein [Candidatus Lokiarchaeota archaeon]|nr:GTP-binding protein [Candidatus Lokiarchaeota archaeon]